MIIFERIRWKNILSYGNTWTTIELNRSPITLITGINGCGKSVLLDALAFGLFGKAYRKINKGQLINIKNERGLLVEIEFTKDTDKFLIRRGMKPDLFELFVNDQLLDQNSTNKDYQRTIERTILNMDFGAFTQIVLIGKATYTSFMRLDPAKRRQFVETILNLEIFSTMNRLHGNRNALLKERVAELKSAVSISREKIKLKREFITKLQSQLKTNKEFEEQRIQEKIDSLKIEKEKSESWLHETKLIDFDLMKYHEIMDELHDSKTEIAVRYYERDSIAGELHRLQNNKETCEYCGQVVTAEVLAEKRAELEEKSKNIEVKIANQETDIINLQQQLEIQEQQKNEFEECQRDIDKHQERIYTIQNEMDNLEKSLQTITFEHYKDSIEKEMVAVKGLESMNSKLENKYNEQIERKKYAEILGSLLKDNGIKAAIIRKFIPIINHVININLAKLGFFAKFTLDEQFNETIQSRGIDTLGFNSFSEGEKIRMDMAVLLAWRELAKIQNNVSTNLLIFDEIFDSSLDFIGNEALSLLLNELEHDNVFIITHTPEKMQNDRHLIEFYKDKQSWSKIK